jgi:hypothetical protein
MKDESKRRVHPSAFILALSVSSVPLWLKVFFDAYFTIVTSFCTSGSFGRIC